MVSTADYACQLGRVIANLHALEFVLRAFLYESVGPQDPGIRFDLLSQGDEVPENPLTNYDSLGTVIGKVNQRLEQLGRAERIDSSLVDVRDAFAHGRMVAALREGPVKLVKFGKPLAGRVRVTASVDLTPAWLPRQIKRTHAEIEKVVALGQALGLAAFPPR